MCLWEFITSEGGGESELDSDTELYKNLREESRDWRPQENTTVNKLSMSSNGHRPEKTQFRLSKTNEHI